MRVAEKSKGKVQSGEEEQRQSDDLTCKAMEKKGVDK